MNLSILKLSLKNRIIFLMFVLFMHVEAESKEKDKVNREVKKIMEMMALPRFGLYQLSSQGDYTSKDFLNASKEVIKYASKMKAVKHPDKDFKKTNEEMLKVLKSFEVAIESGKKGKIKKEWERLSISCNSCHALYNIK